MQNVSQELPDDGNFMANKISNGVLYAQDADERVRPEIRNPVYFSSAHEKQLSIKTSDHKLQHDKNKGSSTLL